ncbi:MAG: hypothetical protein Q4Q03_02900, partial [Bowdeniella nasicola]|nr:hypothetical protein [Bowdeniella nasicola]
DVVTVQTGYAKVRTSVTFDLDDRADFQRACEIAATAMAAVSAVVSDPPPQALLKDTGSGTIALELRFWSGARQLETREARHAVIAAVLTAFADNGVATGADLHYVQSRPPLPGAHGDEPSSS